MPRVPVRNLSGRAAPLGAVLAAAGAGALLGGLAGGDHLVGGAVLLVLLGALARVRFAAPAAAAAWTFSAYQWLAAVSLTSALLLVVLASAPALVAAVFWRRWWAVPVLAGQLLWPWVLTLIELSWVSPSTPLQLGLGALTSRVGAVGVDVAALALAAAGWYAAGAVPLRPGATLPSARARDLCRTGIALAAAVVAVTVTASAPGPARAGAEVITAAVVQPPPLELRAELLGVAGLEHSAMAALQLSGVAAELVLFPESTISGDPRSSHEIMTFLGRGLLAAGDPVLVSGVVAESSTNPAVVVDGGELVGWYDKVHLVPGSERDRWFTPRQTEWATFTPGAGPVLVPTRVGPVGMLVCYDIGFAALTAAYAESGASILVLPSSTRRLGPGSGYQQLHLARVRALESGRPVLVASHGGPSAVIDAAGHIIAQVGRDEIGVAASEVRLAATTDRGAHRGVGVGGGVLGLAAIAAGRHRRARLGVESGSGCMCVNR
jgi:apolipoprotein N-acyltransferase